MMLVATKKRKWTLWIATTIVVLYAYSVYISFFSQQLGYVYDPGTDRLFQVSLTPNISTCDKWTPLIPFHRCYLGEVGNVVYRGTLRSIEAKRNLMKENPKEWLDNQNEKIDELLSGHSTKELEFWNIEYFRTPVVPVAELLPKRLSVLENSTTDQNPDVIAADVVIARMMFNAIPAEIEVVRNAVLIRGMAARRLLTWMEVLELDELPN
ncbi:MAG: hypothetical protein Nkreftii_000392 [Candidatus Nitrospira kreftii]|uniref:Uncharacterized protein n=1 Tax=Candidatus Nitrospira kreftii TaxID=2652173 RepID=A0A7S8FB65_9BACT|nr:MAG: hypothetical protein Nkreftii_000392 [Candidatus Nitrospira kreftii]